LAWHGDPVRTLVVGAGLAGLTLAGRLCQQGRPPVIVERSTSLDAGYAIGLYPLGSCVLHGLGTYERLVDRALCLERYELSSGTGRVLKAFDMSVLTGAVGPLLMIGRSDLVRLLEESCTGADLRRGVTVTTLRQDPDAVEVAFDDGTTEWFDVVVACDGVESSTRDLVFGPATGFDSGWVLWTWWANAERFDSTVAREWWGTGWVFGVYPAPGQAMCAAAGPASALRGDDARSVLRRHLADLIDHVPALGASLDDLREPYLWAMRDVRADRWVDRRVALCGDSAVSVMPTAGVGASNAMRAAAGLADEFSRADARTVPLALELYEKRCRSVVERNQTDSRRVARVMFVSPPLLSKARDELAHHYPTGRMLNQIVGSMREPF
jgi:2-polyprenyl-6-methoxyphenol hydroxylase-like FAD-dependent oxidoreductase